ncbi:MAG TPA: cation-translocating P-type ATPase, partial [Bacteroidota bacterium]|nr:cation-translocating P-type ATPase [Bacteroidota bacterium]
MTGPAPAAAEGVCTLCGLALPRHPHRVPVNGEDALFCCSGCRKVFLLLSESGLLGGDFRSSDLYRTSLQLGIIGRPDDLSGPADAPAAPDAAAEIVYHIEGMWCSSCSWLIEKVVSSQKGVVRANVMYASDTARISYLPEQTPPAAIGAAIERLGYRVSSPASLSDARAEERRSLLVRMGVALFLMMNIMFFSYVLYVGYFQELAPEMAALVPWILLGLALPSVFWCGLPIHRKAWAGVRNGAPTMEVLFTIGILASFFYSVHSVVAGSLTLYFDTSASLVALLLVGKFLEVSAKQRASEGIGGLNRMLPRKVRILASGVERLVACERLRPGDEFVVRPGEKIPADGVVLKGEAAVDESLLTGESRPVRKQPGDRVIASSMDLNGHMTVRATSVGEETVIAGIIRLVERALSVKSPLERSVDRIARVFIPSVLLLSVATGLVVYLTGHGGEEALLRSITVLVIACPCVLGMATPLAIAAGIGSAAKKGILIRDAEALQRAAAATVVVFDKTGTLTEGRFAFLECRAPGGDERTALRLLGSLERSSGHPLAASIVDACGERGIALSEPSESRHEQGRGVAGRVDGRRVVIGTEAFVGVEGFKTTEADRDAVERERADGKTITYFGLEGMVSAGVCVFGDMLKEGGAAAVHALTERGIRVVLLSGDARATALAVAGAAGIGECVSDALPAAKVALISRMQAEGGNVVMVGDGVNDAPAIAQADLGIAMGSGAQIAVESSGITLMRDDLSLVPEAIATAKRTVKTVRQN